MTGKRLTIRPGQEWSMAALAGGRTRYRILSVDGDNVLVEIVRPVPLGKSRVMLRQKTLSASALLRGVRSARMELDEHGTVINANPITAIMCDMRKDGAELREIACAVNRSPSSVHRSLRNAAARGR